MLSTPAAEELPPAQPRPVGLALSSSGVFLISVAIQFIGFIGSLALMRQVGYGSGKALLGLIQLYLLIGSSINGIGDLRLGSAYVFFVARGQEIRSRTGTYLIVRLGLVALAGLSLFLLAPHPFFGSTLASSGQDLTVLGVFLALPILWSFPTVYNQYWIALGNSLRAQLPLLVESVVRTPLLIYVAFANPTLEGITYAYVAGAIASFAYSLPTVIGQSGRFDRAAAAGMFRYAWPLMGSLVLAFLATTAIPFIVNASLGTQDLNIFLAANGFRILLLALPAAVTIPLFPYVARLHHRSDFLGVRSVTWQSIRYTGMLLVPGIVALVTYRVNWFVVTANATYAGPGATPLALLAISAFPLAIAQIMGTSLNAVGLQRLELYLTSAQVTVLFVVAFLLLPPVALLPASEGIVSASIAVLVSSAAAMAVNAYFMTRLMAVHIDLRSTAAIVGSAAVAFFAVSRFNTLIPVNRYFQLLAGVILGFAVYFVVLAVIGELSRDDVFLLTRPLGVPRRLSGLLARLTWRTSPPQVASVPLSEVPGLRPIELPSTFTGETELPPPAPEVSDNQR